MKIAGIGSRETPDHIINNMIIIGKWCNINNIIVRSGHAEGADYAFESGAKELCEIFLPWKTFNSNLKLYGKSFIFNESNNSEMWLKFHPSYDKLTPAVKKLMGRNAQQILGENYNDPVTAVVCWTLNGKEIGGTSQAIRIAKHCNIPIINMGTEAYNTCQKVIYTLTELYFKNSKRTIVPL